VEEGIYKEGWIVEETCNGVEKMNRSWRKFVIDVHQMDDGRGGTTDG
jgi:hypothetical protein